jgi:nicotinate-nucleotide adenylyltransferase
MLERMRLGVFGGSFDPVHNGHLLLAECCQRQARLDRVLFVPAARQPLKPWAPQARDADRLAMLRLAVEARPGFDVATIELDRGGVSYTVETLRALKQAEPEAELFFLMGADALAELPHWREPQTILSLATPIAVHRAGSAALDFEDLASIASPERVAAIRALPVDMPPTPISSSEIRRLIAEDGPWQPHVPAAVAAYIEERRLYRGREAPDS